MRLTRGERRRCASTNTAITHLSVTSLAARRLYFCTRLRRILRCQPVSTFDHAFGRAHTHSIREPPRQFERSLTTQAATLRPARDHQRTRVDAHQRARHSWLRDLRAPRWQRRQFIPTQFARRDLQGRIQLQEYSEPSCASWGYFHQVKTLRVGVHFCTAILRYGRFPPVPFAPAPPRRHPGNAALPPFWSRPLAPAAPDTTHCRLPRSHANNP